MSAELKELQDEIIQLKQQLETHEKLIDELSVPIIPSVIPETLLVPLTGTLTIERFQNIVTKLLFNIDVSETDTVLIDFTGIYLKDLNLLSHESLSNQISQLKTALDIMGVETIFVGFSPEMARVIVTNGLDINRFKIQANFRTALSQLMKDKGLKLQSIEN